MKKVKISVLPEDIAAGRRSNAILCPLAIAIARALEVERVIVRSSGLVRVGSTQIYYELPIEARDRMKSFDMRGEMEPFEFELHSLGGG